MDFRVLADMERRALSPEAIKFFYKITASEIVPPAIIEHAMLNAVMINRVHKAIVDVDDLKNLLDKAMYFELNGKESRDDTDSGDFRCVC